MKTKGFTLIELLVVLGVLTILFSIGIYNITQQTEYTHLDLASKRMTDILNLARKNAIAGQMMSTCDRMNGYKIITDINSSQTTMKAECSSGDVQALTYTFNTVPGIVITQFNMMDVTDAVWGYDLTSFSFKNISGLISVKQAGSGNILYPSENQRVRIVIKNTNTNMCSQFRINSTGFVNDCKIDSCNNLSTCYVNP